MIFFHRELVGAPVFSCRAKGASTNSARSAIRWGEQRYRIQNSVEGIV
jgi:hypothetical protein